MNQIKIWNDLCDFLEYIVPKYPLLFGTRQILYSTKIKKISLKEHVFIHMLYMYSKRKTTDKDVLFDSKIIYYINSPSVASIKQAQSLMHFMKNNGMIDNLVFIVSFQIQECHPKWIQELETNKIQWINQESTPVYNSIFKLLHFSVESFLLTFKLKKMLNKNELNKNIIFNFNKISSCIFQDLVVWNSTKYLLETYGIPKTLISASDMVPCSHAVHALFSSLNIPNYVYQHGMLGLLQSRHHPKTKAIVWGKRHSEYLKKIKITNETKIIGSLRLKNNIKKDVIFNNKKEKKILLLPGGLDSIDRIITKEYLESYEKGLKLIVEELSKTSKVILRLRPDGIISNYWNEIIKINNIILSNNKLSLNEEIENADICLTDFSTTGYESMLLGKPTLFYFPYPAEYINVIGICVSEQTYSDVKDIIDTVNNLATCKDYYDAFMIKQSEIVSNLFVSNDEKNKRLFTFLMENINDTQE